MMPAKHGRSASKPTSSMRFRVWFLSVAAALLVAAGGYGLFSLSGLLSSAPKQLPANTIDAWSQAAASDTLVTDPTTHLTAQDIVFLRQVASRTWNFLSGPDLNPTTHLLRDSILLTGEPGANVSLAAPSSAQEYTNPALIGTYLTCIVAARDLGLITPEQAEADAAATLSQLQKMARYQGFFYRWYSTQNGAAIATPQGEQEPTGYVSSVDNGWLAQGLLVAKGAFPQLAVGFGSLLDGMQWQLLYNRADNVLYNGYQVGKGYSNATYDNAYSGPRIADEMAIGSGKVPGALWWGLNRTPPATHHQRQVPQGQTESYTDPQNHQTYQVFEGHYVYDQIKFVPTFTGSIYQALAPDLIFPEQTMAPNSLGLNDRNTALAQGAYAAISAHSLVWGWAPTTTPGKHMKYTNYGVPNLAINQGAVSDAVVAPYAAFLTLPVISEQAYANIAQLVKSYPSLYTQYGFLDSVDIRSGQVAARYMAVSQMTILMSIDNAVDHDQLQSYAAHSTYAQALAPYMSMEQYSIQGLDQSTPQVVTTPLRRARRK